MLPPDERAVVTWSHSKGRSRLQDEASQPLPTLTSIQAQDSALQPIVEALSHRSLLPSWFCFSRRNKIRRGYPQRPSHVACTLLHALNLLLHLHLAHGAITLSPQAPLSFISIHHFIPVLQIHGIPASLPNGIQRRAMKSSSSSPPSSAAPSSPSSSSPAPASTTWKSLKKNRTLNATDPSLLDLVGFRAGLDKSYRLKRQSALQALSGEASRKEGGRKGRKGGGKEDEVTPQEGGERKPWGYWKDISQIKVSVEEFWTRLNVTSSAIPNEMLLRLYDAHGLRHAIYKQGGRETLAYLLETDYIPGDFRVAMKFPEVQALVEAGVVVPPASPENKVLLDSPSLPPSAQAHPLQERRLVIGPRGGAVILNERLKNVRFPPSYGKPDGQGRPGGWKYQNRTVWSIDKLAEECYTLAEEHSASLHVPLLFFPKLSDLVGWGRANMINTIRRYGGYEAVISSLGFIPFSQWNYFCRFYLLMKDLKTYLDEEEGGSRQMPTLRDVKRAGYHRLYSEVARNGGRKLVAARLGLPLKAGSGEKGKFATMISYGAFDFDFGVALLEYIMNKCWAQHPRERAARREKERVNLFLPTAEELVGDERQDLLEKIVRYGGFENVARRLQLGFKS